MLNTVAAATKLANVQVMGRKRRVVTLLIFLLPLIIGWFVNRYGAEDPLQGYAEMITGLMAMVLVPFLATYWGSAVLTDEIEGRTLVFLWTRPTGRARLFLLKFAVVLLWLTGFCALSVCMIYLVLFAGRSGSLLTDAQMIPWDVRALVLGGSAYAAFAFLLAAMVKRPLMIALIYAYTWDGIAAFLPGFLKRLSLRHYVVTLTTQPPVEEPQGIMKVLADGTTTEGQALITLLVVTVVFAIGGALLLRTREFWGDDPARGA